MNTPTEILTPAQALIVKGVLDKCESSDQRHEGLINFLKKLAHSISVWTREEKINFVENGFTLPQGYGYTKNNLRDIIISVLENTYNYPRIAKLLVIENNFIWECVEIATTAHSQEVFPHTAQQYCAVGDRKRVVLPIWSGNLEYATKEGLEKLMGKIKQEIKKEYYPDSSKFYNTEITMYDSNSEQYKNGIFGSVTFENIFSEYKIQPNFLPLPKVWGIAFDRFVERIPTVVKQMGDEYVQNNLSKILERRKEQSLQEVQELIPIYKLKNPSMCKGEFIRLCIPDLGEIKFSIHNLTKYGVEINGFDRVHGEFMRYAEIGSETFQHILAALFKQCTMP